MPFKDDTTIKSYLPQLEAFLNDVEAAAKKHFPNTEEKLDENGNLLEPFGGYGVVAYISQPTQGGEESEIELSGHKDGRSDHIATCLFCMLEREPELMTGIVDAALERMDEEYD